MIFPRLLFLCCFVRAALVASDSENNGKYCIVCNFLLVGRVLFGSFLPRFQLSDRDDHVRYFYSQQSAYSRKKQT